MIVCAAEFLIVGHLVSYEERHPETDRLGVIMHWQHCKDVHDVRALLGTAGTCHVFIKDYSKIVESINKLMRYKVPFEWNQD